MKLATKRIFEFLFMAFIFGVILYLIVSHFKENSKSSHPDTQVLPEVPFKVACLDGRVVYLTGENLSPVFALSNQGSTYSCKSVGSKHVNMEIN